MSGQRESHFRIGPAYTPPNNSGAAQPSVQTQQTRGHAAEYDTTPRPLSNLGSTLGEFFKTGAKTAEALQEIDHRQELVKIERQNKALVPLAEADKAAGTAPRPEFMGRQAYAGAYTEASAAEVSRQAVDGFRKKLTDMPLDGSVSPRDLAEQHFRDEFGPKGTGLPEFDAAFVNHFRQSVEPLVVQAQERVNRTVETNQFETIKSDAINTLLDPAKATPGALADMQSRVLVATRGNQEMADKLMEHIVGSASMNDGNVTAILNSLQQTGYAKRNPDAYLRMSEQAFHRTNAIKTWQAGAEVEQWGSDFDAATRTSNGFLPLPEVIKFAQRAFVIDSKHGVGSARFTERLNHAWAQSAKGQAETNVILTSLQTGRPGALVAAEAGVEISKAMEQHFDPAVAQFVQMNAGQFPELGKTAQGQMVNPLASAQAAKEYGRLIGQPAFVNAAPGGQSGTYKTMMGNALLGTDPGVATNVVHALAQYEALNGPDMTRKLVRSDDEWNIYIAAKTSGKEYAAYFQARHDNPSDTQLLDAANSGTLNWATLLGKTDGKREEIEKDVRKAQDAALLKSIGRDGWFRDPKVSMSDRMRAEFDSKMAQFMAEQRRSNGSLDVGDAAKHVLSSLKTETTAVPGQGGGLILYPKTRGLGGEVRDNPIKLPNGKTAYAPGKLRNYAEEEEDTLETWHSDMGSLTKALPGALNIGGANYKPDDLYLDAPGSSGTPGLHTVLIPGGRRVTFVPGQPFTVTKTADRYVAAGLAGRPVKISGETVNEPSPKDPVEFQKYAAAKLPKGFHLIEQHDGNQGVFYVLGYGFRLQKDREWFDTETARKSAEFERRKADALANPKQPAPDLGPGRDPSLFNPHGI